MQVEVVDHNGSYSSSAEHSPNNTHQRQIIQPITQYYSQVQCVSMKSLSKIK